ncbi:sigma-70 family RNA polymerase sigma factor, partial [Alteromonas sp. 14N.309.X.WAT.G.H12]
AVNSAKNYLVAQSRKPPASDVDADEADFYEGSDALKEQSTPERSLLSDELEATLFRVVEKLPDDLRMAITLREIEGLSYEEIANVMGCPVGTVRSRIFRAREAIDKVIQPLLEN